VQLTRLPLGVETQGQQTLGMTVADRRPAGRQSTVPAYIDVALDVDAPRVLALFAARVLSSRARQASQQAPHASVMVVGSVNTDLTVQLPHLPTPGETVLGAALHTAFGGKGANQALAAQRAGARVCLVAKLGQDRYGQDYVQYLQQEGLDVSGVRWDQASPSGVALITVDRHGHNQIAVAPGANSALTPADLDGLEARFAPGQVLLTQLEIPLATVETALRQAKAAGLTTVLNPAPARPLPTRLTRLIDILIPNEVEAAVLCGYPAGTLRQARVAARRLHKAGYRTVIITLGKRGVVYTTEAGVVHLPACTVQAKDTTAAGDTFVGYLACALAEGQPLPSALRLATAAAALAVTQLGAQSSIPHRQAVQQFLATR
jgi:ribokinase